MPSIFAPDPTNDTTTGVPWYSPSGITGPQVATRTTGLSALPPGQAPSSSSRPRFYATNNGPVTLPSDWSADDANQWVSAYNQYIDQQTKAYQAASGVQRDQIYAQIEDAKQGRANALKTAQLQADTARYGYDQTRQNEIEQRQQNQKQFDANHALDLQKFGLSEQQLGLDTAKAYTQYASTPDMVWSQNDFKDAMARTSQGLQPTAIGANPNIGTPQPKTWDQFSVLANYGPNATGSLATGSTGGGTGQTSTAGGTNANGGPATPTGTGSTTDPRQTAVNAIMKAIPPSDGTGHDSQDWAALNSIKNLYFSGAPGSVERLGAARQKIAQAGLAREGIDPNLATEDYKRRGLGQGLATAA